MALGNQHSRSLVLGFHGCDETVGLNLINGTLTHLSPSRNPYDWLGDGIYFLENDAERALHFAKTAAANPNKKLSKGTIVTPFVVGAIIDLGLCLDLSHQTGIAETADAFEAFAASRKGRPLPTNKPASQDDDDFIVRNLDRAVVNYLHRLRREVNLQPYDTVRSPFAQGPELAPTSAFHRYSHVQIAVRNAACILGYFLPKDGVGAMFQGLEPKAADT